MHNLHIIRIKVAFLEIPLILCFGSSSIVQNKSAESAEIFSFLLSSKGFCQTCRSDTILVLETLDEYHLDVFSQNYSFQDFSINHLEA